MSNKKLKRKIKLFIILLFLILITFLIILQRTRIISKEGVLDILIFGINNLNYTEETDNKKVQVFGKKEKISDSEAESETYNDYENNNSKYVHASSKYFSESLNNGIEDMSYYKNYISPYFENDKYNYKYIGKKKIDGKKCIVVEFSTEEKSEEINLYIDTTTNLIVKIEKYKNNTILDKKEKVFEEKYNFSSGSNTLKDVTISESELSDYNTLTF